MGISGFLAGLARTAGAAAPFAANVMAAKKAAEAQGATQNAALTLKLMQLRDQQRRQDALDQLSRSQSTYYGARAQDLMHPKPKVTMGVDGLETYDPSNPGGTLQPIGARKAQPPVPGTPEYYKMLDKSETIKAAHRPPPQATITVLPGTNGVAQGVVTHGPGLGHTMALPDVNKAAGGTSSPLNVINMARVSSGVAQMQNADDYMLQFEQKLKAHQASFDGLDQFLSMTGKTLTHEDPVSNGITSTALVVLNHKNPELARYIRRGLEFAQGESQVTQRPSDYRTKLSDFLVTATSGATPDMLNDVANTRQVVYGPMKDELDAYRAAHPAPGRAPAGGASGNTGNSGNSDLRTPGAPKAPAAPRGTKVPSAAKDYGIFGNP